MTRAHVVGHNIDIVRQVLPGPLDAFDFSLPAELALCTDFSGHPRHFSSELTQRLRHSVDGVFEVKNLAVRSDHDLLRKVTAGDSFRDLRNGSHLVGQVLRHQIDIVGNGLQGRLA